MPRTPLSLSSLHDVVCLSPQDLLVVDPPGENSLFPEKSSMPVWLSSSIAPCLMWCPFFDAKVPLPYVAVLLRDFESKVGRDLVDRKPGEIFRMRGLIAAAAAQNIPVFASTELHIVTSNESPFIFS